MTVCLCKSRERLKKLCVRRCLATRWLLIFSRSPPYHRVEQHLAKHYRMRYCSYRKISACWLPGLRKQPRLRSWKITKRISGSIKLSPRDRGSVVSDRIHAGCLGSLLIRIGKLLAHTSRKYLSLTATAARDDAEPAGFCAF